MILDRFFGVTVFSLKIRSIDEPERIRMQVSGKRRAFVVYNAMCSHAASTAGKSKQHVLCKSEPSLERECDSWITSNQSKVECGQDCLRTALYLELGQDMAYMRLYCIFGHMQVLGNILIRLSQGKQV